MNSQLEEAHYTEALFSRSLRTQYRFAAYDAKQMSDFLPAAVAIATPRRCNSRKAHKLFFLRLTLSLRKKVVSWGLSRRNRQSNDMYRVYDGILISELYINYIKLINEILPL